MPDWREFFGGQSLPGGANFFALVVERAERLGISNRNAALGVQRVRDAKGTRGLFP